ncbi:SRPBCC family protein [Intrasporangium sp. YIM S08009]|uniref:SRPBCC family protein n=1 Tax=Intrasporangium zincisolvens TaxID=3080018 RepID=UPI002B05FB52|nr:SRPBCC family protein [Intrasporangium sp. YIM S08009]
MEIERSVTVDRPVDAVFAYLSDFTTTTEWDPGTVSTERVSGDGDVGTRYRNTSSFLGRQTRLDYLVIERVPGQRFALRGENPTVVANDTMTFVGQNGRTTVTYRADFEFKGIARFVAPLLAPALKKLGDDAEKGMRDALERLE